MLITQAARDQRASIAARWDRLDAFLAGSPDAAAKLHASLEVLRAHWKEVDQGILSDTDEVQGACFDMDTAENYAAPYGYQVPPEHGHCKSLEDVKIGVLIDAGHAAEDYCHQHPDAMLCSASVPKDDKSWCQRVGMGEPVCNDQGLATWVDVLLVAAGVTVVGALAVATVKAAKVAAPIALAATVPPHVLAAMDRQLRSGGA